MRKVKFTFPNGFTAHAVVLDEDVQASDALWESLAEPLRIACHNCVSTGRGFIGFPRAPKEPMMIINQGDTVYTGEGVKLLTDVKAGEVYIRDRWNLFFIWGRCTEPLNPGGPQVLQVAEEDLEQYVDACHDVWLHTYFYHKLAVIVMEREEA